MKLGKLLTLVTIVSLLAVSCNDPLFLGSDLLKQDQVGLGYTDTISMNTTTIRQDTFQVYNPSVKLIDAFLVGNYNDTHFGKTKATTYLQYRLGTTQFPDFTNTKFDSLVLGMVYDTLKVYGDYAKETTLNVFALNESMVSTSSYVSDKSFNADPSPIGSLTFIPNPTQKISFTEYHSGVKDTINTNQMRIRLSDQLGMQLMSAPDSVYKTNDNFLKFFKGIKISAQSENNGMLSFLPLDLRSKISLFYSRNDTSFQYDFIVSSLSARTVAFEHDYAGAFVEKYINSSNKSDSLAFLQGMQGTLVKVEMPYITALKDKIVNKAELNIYVKEFAGESPLFRSVANVLLSEKKDSGKFVSINDVLVAISVGGESGLSKFFGGTLVEESVNGQKRLKYKMDISSHIQKMIKGSVDQSLYLTVYRRGESANRVALYGTGSVLPPQLKITFTDSIQ